ncbi:MAG: ATP-dependent zinc metalloprotease FtsH, partial [Oscillospiraceae bacterium]
MDSNQNRGRGLSIALLIIAILTLFYFVARPTTQTMTYSELMDLFRNEQITEFSMNLGNGQMTYTLEGDAQQDSHTYTVPDVNLFVYDVEEYIDQYNADNPDSPMQYDYVKSSNFLTVLVQLLPTIMMIIMFIFLFSMMSQQGGKGITSIGKSRAKMEQDASKKATFADVAGADEEKEELEEIVQYLMDPSSFTTLGAKIPKGVLLVGPPGTGKTLLARAVAGEAGVPFFSISGSDFVELYVGVGASRVRDLFEKAKKARPSIIFIDEIDAVGRRRGAGLGGGHDEREQTLNQLLVEMDGFTGTDGVIVMAATNRVDILDPALLRSGRFDRQIYVGMPDVKGREEILKVHARNKPLGPDVNLKTIAKTTVGFSGADLENLLNEAALLAARKKRRAITQEDIEEASIKVVAGPEKKSHVMTEKEKRLTAFHEAGHAVATYYMTPESPVHQVTIIPRGAAGGFTMSLPSDDTDYQTKTQMENQIVVLLGGRVAEQVVFGDISTGASSDIQKATDTARAIVTK